MRDSVGTVARCSARVPRPVSFLGFSRPRKVGGCDLLLASRFGLGPGGQQHPLDGQEGGAPWSRSYILLAYRLTRIYGERMARRNRDEDPIYCRVVDGAGWSLDPDETIAVRTTEDGELEIQPDSGFGPVILIAPDVVTEFSFESKRGGWGLNGIAVGDALGVVPLLVNKLGWSTRVTVETCDGFTTVQIDASEDAVRGMLRPFVHSLYSVGNGFS